VATTKPVVYVEWVDAVADAGWAANPKAEIHECVTVGFLVDETKDALCIASTLSREDTNARMHIPKAWVKKRRRIVIETKQRKSKRKSVPAVGTGQDHNKVWPGE
jgi:hypothetical protein